MSAEFTIDGVPDFRAIEARIRRNMVNASQTWAGAFLRSLVKERLSGRPGLNRRTGNLSRDWVTDVTESGGQLAVEVKTQGVANAYAGIHEDGGTIRPTKSKYLWIPLKGNLTPSGVARISPREAIGTGNLFIQWNKGPIAYMRRRMARGWHLEPLFVLKKSVTIPARMGAGIHFRSKLPDLSSSLAESMRIGWEG